MRMDHEHELAAAWDAVADWTTYVLLHEGLEGVALGPLSGYVEPSQWIIRREARSDSVVRRRLAAMLAGRLTDPDPDLLSELFEGEARRIRERTYEDDAAAHAARIDSAAVGESLVDAAARWARSDRLRDPALEVLRRILEAGLAGEPWSGLERAALVLALRGEPGDREILSRLSRMLAANLDGAASRRIDRVRGGDLSEARDEDSAATAGDAAAREFRIGGEARDAMDRLLEAAEAFERGA